MPKKSKTVEKEEPKLEVKPVIKEKLETPVITAAVHTPKPEKVKKPPINLDTPELGQKVPSTLEFYIRALASKNISQIIPVIQGLAVAVSRIDWWDPKEILEAMIKAETQGKNRADVLKYLYAAERVKTPAGLSNAKFDEKKHARGTFPQKYPPKKFGK